MIPVTILREPERSELDALLALNNAHAREVGGLTMGGFAHLVAVSFRTRATSSLDAFLIALEQGADYGSPNYLWFSERFDRFAYIDRIAVAESARRKGFARTLYGDLIDAAIAAGHETLACEVNFDPPNPVSDAFHAAFGFREIGRARLPDRGKSVRYLVLPLHS